MSTGLDQQTAAIYAPVRSRLDLVEERLRALTGETHAELKSLLDYVLSSGGKRVRPALTLLASDFYPHDEGKPVIMAAATELLHLATLIHDDTVDNAEVRRGRATVSSVWGKHLAVLLGDYVFAASATFVCDTDNIRVIHRFSRTIMELASGEISELFNCYNVGQAREQYYDRIYRKTASLCSAPPPKPAPSWATPPNPRSRPSAPTATTWAWPFRLWTTCWTCRATPANSASPWAATCARAS